MSIHSLYTWTVDVEYDVGGRTNGTKGISTGLPIIIDIFKQYNVRALFFVSTELTATHPGILRDIRLQSHEVGSHGHFHQRFKEAWRKEEDKRISLQYFEKGASYRAPWFSYETKDPYSKRENHVSVLKHSWKKEMLPLRPIFYIHPFDIVRGSNAPNLFTKILYSRPEKVLETFKRLVRLYPFSPGET